MAGVLPPFIEPEQWCDHMDSPFDVTTGTDGCTYWFCCETCGDLVADLICGAEP